MHHAKNAYLPSIKLLIRMKTFDATPQNRYVYAI